MNDELIIGNVGSYTQFEATVKERKIGMPKKKEIKETVPFSNTTYDFTAINGEIYWNEREIEYILEIIADSPTELEEKKRNLATWLMNVMSEDIYDPFDDTYHFKGTCNDVDFEDDESMFKTTATVSFSCYPYRIANEETQYTATLSVANTEYLITVNNNSAHRIIPTFVSDKPFTIIQGDNTYSAGAGTIKDDKVMLPIGESTLKLKSNSPTVTVSLKFLSEVF